MAIRRVPPKERRVTPLEKLQAANKLAAEAGDRRSDAIRNRMLDSFQAGTGVGGLMLLSGLDRAEVVRILTEAGYPEAQLR